MEGVAPIPLRFMLACLLRARSVRRPGALARVRVLLAVPVGAGSWGGGGGRAPALLTGAAVPPGEGGTNPSASGGWGPAPLRLAGRRGGLGGGGVAPRPPYSPSGGRPAAPYPAPYLVVGASPPHVRARSGPRGRPVHWALPPWRGGGGEEGRPVDCSPGSPFRPVTSLCPPRVANIVGSTMLWSSGARPPYCSGARPRAAPGRGPRAAPARWCGLAHQPRPLREQAAGGAGARGVQVQLRPPPRVAVPSRGGGASLRLRRGGGPALLRPSSRGGSGGGGEGGCSAAPRPLAPPGVILPSIPPGYTRAVGVAALPWASGAARSAANGSVRREGGEEGGGDLLTPVRAPAFPKPASEGATPFALSWAPPVRCRSVAGRAGA